MIQCQVKLKLTRAQERELLRWLYHLASIWNWAIRKIELDAQDKIYHRKLEFHNLLAGHGPKLGIPSHTIQGVLHDAYQSWQRCFKKLTRKPRFKSQRNKLNSIVFPDPFYLRADGRIKIPVLGYVGFFKQEIPQGRIKSGRIVKRASGWYLCLFIDAERSPITVAKQNHVGVDPGFGNLLTLSSGEKVTHPRELVASANRVAQAQRGHRKKLSARLQERVSNRRKDRNHKLSHRLVAENQFIVFSVDPHKVIAKLFGKSVTESAHYQLRQMLSYKSKCRTDGLGVYVEVNSRNSTKTCSACGALSGPTGLTGLKVRQWTCVACGAEHDRDINAAVNTLIAGAGLAHERLARVA